MNITNFPLYEELPEPVFQDMKKEETRKSQEEISNIINQLLKEIEDSKK